MDAANIISSINTIAEKIFKSVEGEVFNNLDQLFNVSESILKKEPLKSIFLKQTNSSLSLLLGSFILLFVIYYLLTRGIALYNGEEQDSIFKFLLRVGGCLIASMSSYYICELLLSLNGMLTDVILSVGEDMTHITICFESLKEIVTSLNGYMSQELLSIDGMIKGVISFGATTLLLTFSIRHVTILILILVSPLAIFFASSDMTYEIFVSWIKLLLTNLLLQNVVAFILIIPLSFKSLNNVTFKIILVGSIYLLYRINNFSKDIFGGFSKKILRRK